MGFFGMLILQLNMPSKLSILKCFAKEIQNPVEKRNKTKIQRNKRNTTKTPKHTNQPAKKPKPKINPKSNPTKIAN